MIKEIIDNIKSNIAQYTELFSYDIESVDATFENNLISIPDLNGEFIITEAVENESSVGSINTIHTFVDGIATTGTFFGSASTLQTVKIQKLRVGSAFARDGAIEAVNDVKTGNQIVVYNSIVSGIGDYKYSQSQDQRLKVRHSIGILFKISNDSADLQVLDDLEKLFINCCIGVSLPGKSLLKFDQIQERYFASKYFIIDMSFSYIDSMFDNDILISSIKHFQSAGFNVDSVVGDTMI